MPAVDLLSRALKLLEEADEVLWELRVLAESIEFSAEFFETLRGAENTLHDKVIIPLEKIGK